MAKSVSISNTDISVLIYLNFCNIYIFFFLNNNFRISRGHKESDIPPSDITFEVRVETEERQVYRQIQRTLQSYRDEKRGPTMLVIQSSIGKLFS